MDIFILSAFTIYFSVLVGIGLYFYTKTKTANEFILGERSTNYFVTAIAAQASDMGAWLFLGFPAAVYTHGFFGAWIAIGLVFFMFLNWHYIAPKLRANTAQLKSLTLSSFFADRFGDSSGSIRLISAFLSLIFFTFYIASGLVGLGRLFESAFELQYRTGVLIGLTTASLYTLIGGFIAVAWCDLVQGIFLLVMIILVPLYGLSFVGGIPVIMDTISAKNISLSLFGTSKLDILYALNLAAWGLGYFGQPHVLTYFMGIDDPKKIKYAKYIGITWQILVLTAAFSVGFIGIAFFSNGIANPELIFTSMTTALLHPLLVGFVLCAILAATFSTLDSQILLSGSVLAEDLYKYFYNKTASEKHLVTITRIGALLISGMAVIIAWDDSNSVFDLVAYAWSGLGASFGPLVIAALYGKHITHLGALSGMIAGGLTAGIWPYFNSTIFPIIPGFVLGIMTTYLVSIFTKNKN